MAQRAQNAVEFLSVYSFAIIIVTIAISLILILSASSTSTIPQECSLFGGFSCTDVIYATWNGVGSQVLIVATFTQPGEVNISSFTVSVSSSMSTNGYCVPNVAAEGETVYCAASLNFLPRVGSTYTGTFTIASNYCAGSSYSLYNYTCPANGNYLYNGNLQLQAESQQLPSGPFYYAPFTVTNTNSVVSTQGGLQVLVKLVPSTFSSYESHNLGNMRFYDGAKELYSWCESNCSSSLSSNAFFWVKLDRAISPGASIYLSNYFLPNSIGYDGVYAGESPLQSNTYAQYDNGAGVFNFYNNFAGRSLNSSIWNNECATQGNTCTVSNGITISTASSGTGSAIYSKGQFGQGVIAAYGLIPSSGSAGSNCLAGFGVANSSSPSINSALAGFICLYGLQTSNYLGEVNRVGPLSSGSNTLYSIAIPSSPPGSVSLTVNYIPSALGISSSSNLPSLPQPIVLINQQNTGLSIGPIYYVRVEDYPAGGTLPTVAAGSAMQVPQ